MQELKEAPPIEELQVVASPVLQEKLYLENNCLVPKKYVEILTKHFDAQSKPSLSNNLNQLLTSTTWQEFYACKYDVSLFESRSYSSFCSVFVCIFSSLENIYPAVSSIFCNGVGNGKKNCWKSSSTRKWRVKSSRNMETKLIYFVKPRKSTWFSTWNIYYQGLFLLLWFMCHIRFSSVFKQKRGLKVEILTRKTKVAIQWHDLYRMS